jgi:hypothetical protein
MPGAISTLNGRGFMLEALDSYALAFAEHAAGGPKVRSGRADAPGPAILNTLDPDILARECTRVGLTVERTSFFGLQRRGDASNGREHAGCPARKPMVG